MKEPINLNEAHSRTGFDGNECELVFSDEFKVDRGTFWPGELLSGFISFSSFLDVFLFIFRSCSLLFNMTTAPIFSYDDNVCCVFTFPPTRINCLILGGILHALFSSASFLISSLGHGYISVNRCCC